MDENTVLLRIENNEGDLQRSYLTKLVLLHPHGKQCAAFSNFSPLKLLTYDADNIEIR